MIRATSSNMIDGINMESDEADAPEIPVSACESAADRVSSDRSSRQVLGEFKFGGITPQPTSQGILESLLCEPVQSEPLPTATTAYSLGDEDDEGATEASSIVSTIDTETSSQFTVPRNRQVTLSNLAATSLETPMVPRKFADYVELILTPDGVLKCYTCQECRYRTDDESAMFADHVPHHMTKEKHTCPSCTFSSNEAAQIISHISQLHSYVPRNDMQSDQLTKAVVEIYRCRHCPFETPLEDKYSEHLLLHSTHGRYHCSLCSFCAGDQKTVLEHEARHFASRTSYLDGLARLSRKYQTPRDKTPFFMTSDVPVLGTPVSGQKLTDEQKEELRGRLANIVDISLMW